MSHACCARPYLQKLACAVSGLARFMAHSTEEHWQRVPGALYYLKSTTACEPVLGGRDTSLQGASDAALAAHLTSGAAQEASCPCWRG